MAAPPSSSYLTLYYLSTPAFALVDLTTGFSVRAGGLESPVARGVYYFVALAFGGAMRVRPSLAPWLAMAESAGNLALLMAAVLVPIWSLPESLDASVVADLPSRVLNLALTGSILVYAFHRSRIEARAR